MSVTNTWVIEQMNCYPQSEGQTDVVFTVHWRVNATDGTFYATSYGTVGVTYVAGSPYTPYAQLTQAQVVGWVQTSMGPEQVASIETGLAANIANQVNPPTVTPALPWASA
jgi:hypothetical protein